MTRPEPDRVLQQHEQRGGEPRADQGRQRDAAVRRPGPHERRQQHCRQHAAEHDDRAAAGECGMGRPRRIGAPCRPPHQHRRAEQHDQGERPDRRELAQLRMERGAVLVRFAATRRDVAA